MVVARNADTGTDAEPAPPQAAEPAPPPRRRPPARSDRTGPTAEGRTAGRRSRRPPTSDLLVALLGRHQPGHCPAVPDLFDERRQLAMRSGSRPGVAGPIVLYTRVRSPRDAAVVHRWYRGDTLRQSVKLTIRANATEGYRTYSRQTVDGRRTGEWKSGARTATCLHEQRFAVR